MEMDDAMIKRESGQYDLELIQRLYLEDQFIKVISNTKFLINLSDLSLARNEISQISGLAHLSNLRRLDLSYNKISSVNGLEGLTNLRWLDLSYNRIETLIDTLDTLRDLPKLESLKLAGSSTDKLNCIASGNNVAENSCIQSKKYPLHVFDYMPQLVSLDGALVAIVKDAALDALVTRVDANSSKEPSAEEILASESWLDSSAISDKMMSPQASVETVTDTQNNIRIKLNEDTGHLLRKADKLLYDKL